MKTILVAASQTRTTLYGAEASVSIFTGLNKSSPRENGLVNRLFRIPNSHLAVSGIIWR